MLYYHAEYCAVDVSLINEYVSEIGKIPAIIFKYLRYVFYIYWSSF